MDGVIIYRKQKNILRAIAFLCLAGIVYFLSTGNIAAAIIIILVPISVITLIKILESPTFLLYVIFTVNYFMLALGRYTDISGISVFLDILLMSELIIIFIHGALKKTIEWKYALNTLTLVTFVWMIYCAVEVINPTGMFEAWFLSRGIIYYSFLVSVIVSLVIVRFKQVKVLLLLYSVFTLLAILKALMQKFIGFDPGEKAWLDGGGASTHIILTGIRYFSFFTDAGNFGSNMGCAATVFGIALFFIENKFLKIYFVIMTALSLYAMFMSGTRGAMAVPLGGLVMFVVVSKNFKALTLGSILLVIIYVFFAHTYIGQDNNMIRRMRTSFHPEEDASFNLRRENQRTLANYLRNKPFGEGIGLSGTENRKYSDRLTTRIAHDSWYVKLWVETGIVGITLYLAGLITVLINCAYIIMQRIKNMELKGVLMAMLCGVAGLMVSAYGNAFFGQMPTNLIVFTFLAIILKGEYFDKKLRKKQLSI